VCGRRQPLHRRRLRCQRHLRAFPQLPLLRLDLCAGRHLHEGACVAPAPAPAGFACDRDGNACSADACDGAGRCVAQGPLDCGPCQFCQPPRGCEARVRPDCVPARGRAHLVLRKGAEGERDRALFAWSDPDPGAGAEGFGDPTSTTELDLCIHQPAPAPDQPAVPVAGLSIAAGGSCGGQPCWTAVRHGFRRVDPGAQAAGGATRVSLRARPRAGTKLGVRGRGKAKRG
jgi:hypothetical protein